MWAGGDVEKNIDEAQGITGVTKKYRYTMCLRQGTAPDRAQDTSYSWWVSVSKDMPYHHKSIQKTQAVVQNIYLGCWLQIKGVTKFSLRQHVF